MTLNPATMACSVDLVQTRGRPYRFTAHGCCAHLPPALNAFPATHDGTAPFR